MVKHLYQNFLTDKKVYNLNRAYWKRKLYGLGEQIAVPLYKEHFANGTPFYDGNPMVSAYVPALNKSIRLIQEEIETEGVEIGAWTEPKDMEGKEVNELVISLELSKEASGMALKLIGGWLKEDWDTERIESELEKLSNL